MVRIDVHKTLVGVRLRLDDDVGELVLVEKAHNILGHFKMAVGTALKCHFCA